MFFSRHREAITQLQTEMHVLKVAHLNLLSDMEKLRRETKPSVVFSMLYPQIEHMENEISKIREDIKVPLIKGLKAKTSAGKKANIKKEIKAGKSQDQAVAIAMSVAGEGKKKKATKKK